MSKSKWCVCLYTTPNRGWEKRKGFNLLLKCQPVTDWDRIQWFPTAAELWIHVCSDKAFYTPQLSIRMPMPSWASVTCNEMMCSLSQCAAFQSCGNYGSGQLVHTHTIQPHSHFFLQGTRREEKAPTWPRHGRDCRGNDIYLLLMQPEILVNTEERRPPARAGYGPSLSPAKAASGSPGQAHAGLW